MCLRECRKWQSKPDPVLKERDRLLEENRLYEQVRADCGKRYRWTLGHGQHSTLVGALLRILTCKHLHGWGYQETIERVADSLVLSGVFPVSA